MRRNNERNGHVLFREEVDINEREWETRITRKKIENDESIHSEG